MAAIARETSGATTRLILTYVRREAGDEAVDRLIVLSGVDATMAELEDARRWWSYEDKVALFEAAAVVLGQPDVAHRIGASALSANVLPALIPLLRAFGGPSQLLRNVARASTKFSTSGVMEALEVRRRHAVVTYRLLPPHVPNRHDCAYTAGVLAQVGPIFGLPEATVVHETCQVRGAQQCTYEVSWARDARFRSKRTRHHEVLALEATAAIDAAQRREDTAAALLRLSRSVADVSSVADTAQRLAEAIPDVVHSDHATVLLWDEVKASFVVGGTSGLPADLEARAQDFRIDPSWFDQPGVPPIDEPTLIARSEASAPVKMVLEAFEVTHVAFVPVRSRGTMLGLLVATWSTTTPDAADVQLEERLRGLADQAASALENARLLETVRRQALHDGLTGLPNQALFADRVRLALARAQRSGDELTIAVLDLGRFKTVNDSLGHACGDELLIEVGRRLQASVREIDTVARMGGDEFTLLLPGPDGAAAAEQIAARMLAAFEDPFEVSGHLLRVSPSIGFALHPQHGDELDDLLKRADAAMYQAKASGRNTWAIYTSGMSEQAYDRLTLEADLFRAVPEHQLVIAYQPVVRIADGAVVGAEALVRWAHPDLGVLLPDQFIPIAEEVGLVADIDAWVLRRACADLGRAGLHADGPGGVAVNVSGRSLTHPSFAQSVSVAIRNGGIRPDQLVLEVTETVTVDEASGVVEALGDLRRLGVRVAVDDFGRGHSALARLEQLPIDQLKVDKAFLREIRCADAEAPVASAIIAMGLGLGLEVLAEGVERPEQLAFLKSRGCDLAQGHLFGRAAAVPLLDVLRPGVEAR